MIALAEAGIYKIMIGFKGVKRGEVMLMSCLDKMREKLTDPSKFQVKEKLRMEI